MKKRTSLGIAALGLTLPAAAAEAAVISFHDANQHYSHAYGSGGYNVLMYGQGAAADPGNNVWNGFGKYGGPGSTAFYGTDNPNSGHGAVPNGNPGQPYAWHSGTSASGTSLFSPTKPANTGNATSNGLLSTVTFSANYESDNGVGYGGSSAAQGTPGFVLGSAALVTGTNVGTFTLQQVPAGTYNLFLYGANYDGTRGASFTASSGVPLGGFTSTRNPNADGAGSPLSTYVLGADYVEFTGVTPNAAGTISGTWSAITNSISGLSGEGDFNGLQLQTAAAAPEPATWAFMACAGVALLARRSRPWRRRTL